MINESPFDLVLLDMVMPKRDGLSTLIELQNLSSPPKVIAMSGKVDFLPKAEELGAVGKLWKPIETELLLSTIQNILSRAS